MRRSNPEPDFLTSNSFTFRGVGVPCYAFCEQNQCVMKSCYTRYNVVLHFFSLFSKSYSRLLQNGISHAYMCACANAWASARAYMCAPTRECLCYIATSLDKSLKRKRKSVAGRCSRNVVCPCYTEKNKILGIYSAEISAAANGGRGGAGEGVRTDDLGGCGAGEGVQADDLGGCGAGEGVRTVENGVSADDDVISKKWRISAVFAVPFNGMFNAMMFNVCEKWRSSAVFRAVGTFFSKMCAVGRCIRSARIGCPGGSPQTGRSGSRYVRNGFFFDFRTEIVFLAVSGGGLFFHGCSGVKGFRELVK